MTHTTHAFLIVYAVIAVLVTVLCVVITPFRAFSPKNLGLSLLMGVLWPFVLTGAL